jgi:hypothetical protein
MKAVLAALVLFPTIASADVVLVTGAPGSGQVAAQPFVPGPASKPKKKQGIDARQDVVASNRGVAAPTAITVPQGTVELTLQSVIPFAALGGLNAGVTKSTELWIEGGAAIADSDEHPYEYGAGIKQVLVRSDKLAIALTGSMRKFSEDGDNKLMSVGGVGTLCIDDECGLLVSGSIARIWGFNESDYDDNGTGENLITLSASAGNATTRVMLEAMQVDGEAIGFFGVRFGNKTTALDLALVTALSEDTGDVPALPWIGVSSRM